MIELQSYLVDNFGFTHQEAELVISFFNTIELQKSEYLLRTNQKCNQLAFLEKGIIREYIQTDGKEITKWISTKGYFIVDLSSFLFDQPSRWNFQALTDCEFSTISKENYIKLGQQFPKWAALEKNFLAGCFIALENRIINHLSMTAEERYEYFFDNYKELFLSVPQQYLASMLGMTPETFSRIRKKQ